MSDPTEGARDDEWLALAILGAITVLARAIRARLGLRRGEQCPRCGHRY